MLLNIQWWMRLHETKPPGLQTMAGTRPGLKKRVIRTLVVDRSDSSLPWMRYAVAAPDEWDESHRTVQAGVL